MSAPVPSGRMCTFRVDSMHFGLDVRKVQEVLREQPITEVPLAHKVIAGVMNLRGEIVVVVDLRELLGLPPRAEQARRFNVLVRTETGPVSMLVDSVGDVIDVTAESFELPPDTLQGPARSLLRGAWKLEHGLLLALDEHKAIDIRGGVPS
jgi:purine-binding chemotaxis protein CheW